MDPKNQKLSSLPPETLKKLLEIEKRKPENQQVQLLSDIAMMVQELLSVADETKADSAEQMRALGAVLTDAREQLVTMNSKETPESPDFAKPVVDAISKLEEAINKIDTKPVLNIPKADAPIVNVDAPKVTVDTKEIARMLKEDIPSAFREAIAMIPATEIPESVDRWDEVIDWLRSIDSASRKKPEAPTQLKVVNVDGTAVNTPPDYATRLDDTSTANTTYIGKAAIGSATSSAVWQIAKLDTSSGLVKTWAGSAGFTQIWDDRTSIIYS